MRSRFLLLLLAVCTGLLPARALGADLAPAIRLNTIGFLPNAEKRASIATTAARFAIIRDGDGATVLEGTASGPVANRDTGELLYLADFSKLTGPGTYRLEIPGAAKSAPFRIGQDLYREPFRVAMLGMYLWRCGTAVSATYGGAAYRHDACHLEDAWLDRVGGGHAQKDGAKGWHDAGDYNKYVVNAGVTVGAMLRAWEDFGPAIRAVPLDHPEANGPIPAFLAEVKWETDWLLTMQAADGSVYHKLSTLGFGAFILPEKETAARFFTPWGSAATADFVAMTAQAARAFKPYDAAYSDRLLAAARKSYAFLQAHPEDHPADQAGFSTGGYGTRDPDEREWAAAEMWETTGDAEALADFERRARVSNARVDRDFDWGEVRDLGVFAYLGSKREGRDPALVAQLRANLLAAADGIVQAARAHGYARPLGERYYWGCNGGTARQTMILEAAHCLAPEKPDCRAVELDALGYLFGRNSYGRSFVTGLGDRPPLHPHDRRSGGDDVEAPWPGYLVGGANPRAGSWQDIQDDYRTNEIAINWNGALIYALAAQLPSPPSPAGPAKTETK